MRSLCSILPAWMREVKIDEGTLVSSQSPASRSRILRAEIGYSLKSHGPVKSYSACAIGGDFNSNSGQLHEF